MNTTQPIVFLKGKSIILRPIEESDAPLLQKWINDPENRQYVLNSFPLSYETEKEFIEKSRNCDTKINFGIEHEDKLIGIIGLNNINWIHRTAVTGTMIGDSENQGKGLGTDAKIALLGYAFDTLGLRKITSSVIAHNVRSKRYGERCGYKVEGIRKEQFLKNGVYQDEIMTCVFRDDFMVAKKNLGY